MKANKKREDFSSRTYYEPMEEKFNVYSHAIGLILSVVGIVLLVLKASSSGNPYQIVSFCIYGASLILLYSASTFYHRSKLPKHRGRLNIFDHSSIYVLIAGTYTPYALVTLNGLTGWIIFGIIWGLAITGIILKLFFTGRFQIASTIMYILMGWIILGAIKPLIENLSSQGILWLFMGGIFYTVGAIFFSINKLKFNHAIFHVFVILGSLSHFVSVYFYVVPII